ncbi:MAG: acyl carrier protein [Acidimicrobiales bacterium]
MSDATNPSPSRDDLSALVREQLAVILERPAEEIGEDVPFSELGADSLALIELVEALEERLATQAEGFHIDDADLEGLSSVRAAVDYLVARLRVG